LLFKSCSKWVNFWVFFCEGSGNDQKIENHAKYHQKVQLMKYYYFLLILNLLFNSCDNYEETEPIAPSAEMSLGTGVYRFNYQMTDKVIPMNIYYHVPNSNLSTMPILFVLHGAGRNAVEYRNAWIEEAKARNFIVITPKFLSSDFPGGDGYNLGNVFEDGDKPSASTLNNEQDWTFSVIEPLFDEVKFQLDNTSNTYDIFGFSAGAQFAHRFMMFKPNARVNKIVASAAGWYTVPTDTVEFPYGIENCPIENYPAPPIFSNELTIQIGTLDNNPNAPGLRRNPIVDQQGTNRYDRAFYMFNTSQSIAENLGVEFNWQIVETPGNSHNNQGAVEQAAEILYGN
jgi:predicted esterase